MDGLKIAVVPDARRARREFISGERSHLATLVELLNHFRRRPRTTTCGDKVIEGVGDNCNAAFAVRTDDIVSVPVFHHHLGKLNIIWFPDKTALRRRIL